MQTPFSYLHHSQGLQIFVLSRLAFELERPGPPLWFPFPPSNLGCSSSDEPHAAITVVSVVPVPSVPLSGAATTQTCIDD
jgi:hypothetical protein